MDSKESEVSPFLSSLDLLLFFDGGERKKKEESLGGSVHGREREEGRGRRVGE